MSGRVILDLLVYRLVLSDVLLQQYTLNALQKHHHRSGSIAQKHIHPTLFHPLLYQALIRH